MKQRINIRKLMDCEWNRIPINGSFETFVKCLDYTLRITIEGNYELNIIYDSHLVGRCTSDGHQELKELFGYLDDQYRFKEVKRAFISEYTINEQLYNS